MSKMFFVVIVFLSLSVIAQKENIGPMKFIGKWTLIKRMEFHKENNKQIEEKILSKNVINYYEFKNDSTYILFHKDKYIESLNSGKWLFIPSENKIFLYNSISVMKNEKNRKLKDHHLIFNKLKKIENILFLDEDDLLGIYTTLTYRKD